MKNTIKNTIYTGIGLTTVGLSKVSADINAQRNAINEGLKGNNDTADVYFQTLLNWVLGFLALIGVFILIYGGFQFLTAAGDEEKVKKGKTMIIQAIIGLLIIFAAWSVVSLVISGLSQTGA